LTNMSASFQQLDW